MTANARFEALIALADFIQLEIPELQGRICTGQADPAHRLAVPSLAIDCYRWTYNPSNAEEIFDSGNDRVVMDVGWHEGNCQLLLNAGTLGERYNLEQKVLDLFLRVPLKPGSIQVQVLTIPELGPFGASFDLNDNEWRDEAVQDGRPRAMLEITGSVPARTTRLEAHKVNQLILGVNESEDAAPTNHDFPSNTDAVLVNEDGTITAV